MAITNEEIASFRELLGPLGFIEIRKMFGGGGVYCDGKFFGLIDDGEFYLKVDDVNQPEFEKVGSRPFTYDGGPEKGMLTMNYWLAPSEMWESEQGLFKWGKSGIGAAERKPPTKKRKK